MSATRAQSVSGSSSSGDSHPEEWKDVDGEEEETLSIVSFFDDKTFPDAKAMLAHCAENHGFDFLATCQRLGLDFHGAVKLCNFVRKRAGSGQPLPEAISAEDLQDDALLRPVLEDDALIIELDEVLAETSAPEPASGAGESTDALKAELASLQDQFANYRLTVEETLNRRWGYDPSQAAPDETKKVEDSQKDVIDSGYWESYAGRDIHELMLKDAVRTDAYRDFVYQNKDIFKGKVVLDIGCGTGILSMFCAKAGAKQVLAVDNSAIIEKARKNIADNGLAGVITCIQGRVEDVKLPVEKVDVIISEWMGYCLLYEAMLPSVLWARDRYLAPDGLLVPSVATIWAAPVSDGEYITDHVSFWKDVYGFKMDTMMEGIYDEALVEVMPADAVCGKPFAMAQLNLHDVKTEDLNFSAKFSTTLTKDIDNMDGFLVWFDMFFTSSRPETVSPETLTSDEWSKQAAGRTAFTTGPFGTETHWKQGLLLAPEDASSAGKAGDEMSGEAVFSSLQTDYRALSIKMDWSGPGKEEQSKTWKLR